MPASKGLAPPAPSTRSSVAPDTQGANVLTLPPEGGVAGPREERCAPFIAGRYELLGVLGSGGMGTVYEARDRELDERVALKVLKPELVERPGMVERFRRELKLARRVTHRNVARAFDIGSHEGLHFLTMELVPGESLARALARQPRLAVSRVLEIAYALCDGLEAAHAAGVVHRDLKPDNVIMARDGRIVVTDFGIARALDPSDSATSTIAGTPSYMAPEQVDSSLELDARADIYALGVILFELFTGGKRPFVGESAHAIAMARLVGAPPDPEPLGAPTAAAPVILRCLARSPGDRFARARDVAVALQTSGLDVGPEAETRLHHTPAAVTAEATTAQFGPRSEPRDSKRGGGAGAAAQDLYLPARQQYLLFETASPAGQLPALRAAAMKSVQLFDEAYALAPDDPAIASGYVLAHARTWFFGDATVRERALDAATRILSLAPERGESHLARAAVDFQRGDVPAATRHASRALALAPSLAEAHELFGRILCETGPVVEGLRAMRTADQLEPSFRSTRAAMLRAYELLGYRDAADELLDTIVARDEGGCGWTAVARVVLWRADTARARSLLEHPVVNAGHAPSARELLRLVLQPETTPSAGKLVTATLSTVGANWRMPVFLEQARAEIGVAKGRPEAAFAALAASVDAGLLDLVWLDGCPLLGPLRTDARFASLRVQVAERSAAVQAAAGGQGVADTIRHDRQ